MSISKSCYLTYLHLLHFATVKYILVVINPLNKSDVKGYSVTVRENANQKWQQTRGNKTWGKRYIQCFVVGYGSFFSITRVRDRNF